MDKTLIYSLLNDEPLVKNSGGNYQVEYLQVGDHIQIQPSNLSKSRQYLAYATGEIKAIKGNKASVLLDEPNKHRTIKIDLCSLRLTSAQEWEQDFVMQDCNSDSISLESQRLTNSAQIFSNSATQECITTKTCMTSQNLLDKDLDTICTQEELICLQLPLPAPHSPLKANDLEAQMSVIASPPSSKSLENCNPSLQQLKMSQDSSPAPTTQDSPQAHISEAWSEPLTSSGMMRNGLLLAVDTLPVPSLESEYCWLRSPGALSSTGKGRPPGQTKQEAELKNLGLINFGEVLNPAILCQWYEIPETWLDPSECRAATELLEDSERQQEIFSILESPRSPSVESCTSTDLSLKAISLWQPWASLIGLGLKHYETRSWKTSYRGKLVICSAAKLTKTQYQQYLKICNEVELPPWNETNFPHGRAIAICDLVDCIEMTAEFIEQQSTTEILCGDWQIGRYAWKLENIQTITEPFAVKGKQGLFNISVDKQLTELVKPKTEVNVPKSSDCWYTPPHIVEKVIEVLGEIDLDPCADDGRHIHARSHFTAADDGLSREWHGRVFMNPPYSCPGVWMSKLQSEVEAGRVTEAVALVPAATDTNWLNPVLKSQPVCFWKGRIKFLDVNYQPKLPARQSHCLVYWGENWEKFREVFEEYGFVSVPNSPSTQLSNDNQVLGESSIPSISPSTQVQGNDQVLDTSLLLSIPPDTQVSNDDEVLGENISPSIPPSTQVSNDNEVLGENISPSIPPSTQLSDGTQVLGESLLPSISPSTQVSNDNEVLGGNISPSIPPSTTEWGDEQPLTEASLPNSVLSNNHQVLGGNISPKIPPSTTETDKKATCHNPLPIDSQSTKRKYGSGSGNLFWGYANANSSKKKPIKQLYFEWEYGGVRGKTYVRAHLKEQVIALNEAKVPITEILKLLTYNPKVKRILCVD